MCPYCRPTQQTTLQVFPLQSSVSQYDMIRACQAVREDIERINHDTEVKKTVAHVKTNIDPETKPSSRASLLTQLSLSPTLALFSFILSFSPYWAAKLSLSFTAYPGREGNNVSTLCSPEYLLETQSGPLIPHILFLSFLSFFFLSHTLSAKRRRGELKQARCKGKLLSVLPFLFSRRQVFLPASSLQAQTHTFHQ